MRSQLIKDDAFRTAAARLHPETVVSRWGAVQRDADGRGAFVEVTVWVPIGEAQRDAEETAGA